MEKEAASELAEDERRQEVLKEEIELALGKICRQRKKWLYMMFFLTASPGILNGMHLMAYVFYVDTEPFHCKIPELERAGWTGEQIRNVSLPNVHALSYGCEYYNYDYASVANHSYERAMALMTYSKKSDLETIPCENFVFESNYSVISETERPGPTRALKLRPKMLTKLSTSTCTFYAIINTSVDHIRSWEVLDCVQEIFIEIRPDNGDCRPESIFPRTARVFRKHEWSPTK